MATDEQFLKEVFEPLKKKLEDKTAWQQENYDFYNGKRTARSLRISVAPELDQKLRVVSGWGQIAVDYLSNQLRFDCFSNDEWRLNTIFSVVGADPVIRSAIKNSMIGACSFIAVTPGNTANGEPPVVWTPYTGYEATGVYNSRTGRLDAGIAIKSYKGDKVADYWVFLPDATYIYDGSTFEEAWKSSWGCQLVPFVFDQDLASNPFGSSRLSSPLKAATDSAVRTLKRSEFASEIYAGPFRYILSKISDSSDGGMSVISSEMGTIVEHQSDENSEYPVFGQLPPMDPTPFINQIDMYGKQAAALVYMNPIDFGCHPVNGSLSGDAENARARSIGWLKAICQDTYGAAIRQCALHTLAIFYGAVDPKAYLLDPAWVNTASDSDLGRIGDGLGKIFEAVPELAETDIAYEKLGIPKRTRLEADQGLEGQSPERALASLSDELKEALKANLDDPENAIVGTNIGSPE